MNGLVAINYIIKYFINNIEDIIVLFKELKQN